MIELIDVSKEYKNDSVSTIALQNINLKISAGEFTAIMGKSGSGKTTLLNIIGCMDIATGGKFFLDNVDISSADERARSRIRGHKIAFVFQHFALINNYSVAENVELPLLAQKLNYNDRKKKVDLALQMVGISDLAKKCPTHISGGQKQRAAIARAIACGADILLADEPTGALDSQTSLEIMKLFMELNSNGKTIILITHDTNVASYAKRVITLKDGRIINDKEKYERNVTNIEH